MEREKQKMKGTDISFLIENIKFNFRVSCVIVSPMDKKILLHKKKGDSFWNLPGGRTAIGESSMEAVKREIREEIGCECELKQLVTVSENFFTLNGIKYHELLMIFSGELENEIDEDKLEEDIEIKWISSEELDHMDIRPECTKSIMRQVCENADSIQPIGWIVNQEEHTSQRKIL